ncbi:CHC2 zinc finger domain-containing protein [Pseudomonas nunensis]|uniref:CHC2 zinc finger domain-containing protein n=1 Tax=Pseudomonas nunensis TaxID=2961896 RepID=UPI0025B03A6F|nr:CHC2 zinc finger domain-containing protein [Pseudomonas nunensis]MDN3219306.1 CHC2 zinc finger domain-containing protein [Pseudomonas nunensis]
MPRIDYEKLLQNVSIEDIANRLGMTLKKTAVNQFTALCPFHDDKTPSLLIDARRDGGRQHFYCFSCGAHGDAIDLVKEQLNLGFKDAVEWLKPDVAVVQARGRNHSFEKNSSSPAVDLSALQFGYNLYKKGSDQALLDAWIAERGLDPIVIKRAGIVYAWRNFLSRTLEAETNRSTRREYTGDLEDAFLIRKLIPGVSAERHLPLNSGSEAVNRYSDFFIADRIIFPIHDEKGSLLGLAGRASSASTEVTVPKYQFTREFPKSTILYRADFAFKLARSEAKKGSKNVVIYLCEGFLDALRFESLGFPAVAIMGSSISEHQVKLLQSLSESLPKAVSLTVVVSFDRDEAGLRGAADACLKLMNAPVECAFLWPTDQQLTDCGVSNKNKKDPNDYLESCSGDTAKNLLLASIYPPQFSVLAYAFGATAEDILSKEIWAAAPRTRRFRAFGQALSQIEKSVGAYSKELLKQSLSEVVVLNNIPAFSEWLNFIDESISEINKSYSEDFLNNTAARLNHSRILAYMGSKRGELPCDEPRWERLDIAATAFNTLLMDRLKSIRNSGPIGPYNAVWVPRSFGGSEFRLKIMPLPEDLIIQQYLVNEILTERWDHEGFTDFPFSRRIPAVRYYREGRRTVTTGFDIKGNGNGGVLSSQTLSFAYQIDMDVLEGRQPATDQGMYRPYAECWRDFMASLAQQATEIGYVYSIRLDVKRYYDRLRRYVVRDRLLMPLKSAIASVSDNTPEFAKLLKFDNPKPDADAKAAFVLDRLDEHLFGVSYARPDTGLSEETNPLMGIPQGPVLSAWIGSVSLFPIDEEAYRFMSLLNVDSKRVGYARYVDDIVLLANDPATLAELREAVDRCARKLELTLLAKADEIPAMSAEDFVSYINEGRALAAYGPAWEPPLVGDGESGWDFWSAAPATDRQSSLQLLHNVELYKASKATLLQTVRTAFQAPDLRASELPKAARLIWYSIAVEHLGSNQAAEVLSQYLDTWDSCVHDAAWNLRPEENKWESPVLFALEGLEHLIDKQTRDIAELSAEENAVRRNRIAWLSELVLSAAFEAYVFNSAPGPQHQLDVRLELVRWKAARLLGRHKSSEVNLHVERSKLFQDWQPFEWMHNAVELLSDTGQLAEDPLLPFVAPTEDHLRKGTISGFSADVFIALLPGDDIHNRFLDYENQSAAVNIALQTIVSIVPKEKLPVCLSRRNHLVWDTASIDINSRLILPPLPGIKTSRLLSCVGGAAGDGTVLVNAIEALDFSSQGMMPVFVGANNVGLVAPLKTEWSSAPLAGSLVRLRGDLAVEDYISLRERVLPVNIGVSTDTLKLAAKLFRSVAEVVMAYSENNEGKELVPAWPYIATDLHNQLYYLIAEGVLRDELGNRAFVRDGGRALRTAEVPIYEASLWRVGVAISDYLGLYDDVAKFGDAEADVTLDAAALTNPARYVLRAQLRKLRGAYANSQISKRRGDDGLLPATVVRSLRLLETFPEQIEDSLDPILYVLAAEAESAGMYLAFRESWACSEAASFLVLLTNKVLGRLPLSVSQVLAVSYEGGSNIRRDLFGQLCFARRLFSVSTVSPATELPSWKALRAGIISTGITVAFEGLIASLRSHGSYERYENFDFPETWGIPPALTQPIEEVPLSKRSLQSNPKILLVEQCRRLVQHLGHRLFQDNLERLSNSLCEQLCIIAKTLASIDYHDSEVDSFLEWPFEMLSEHCLNLLSLELLESVVLLVKKIDEELGFETVLVVEKSYGYNPQTKRFTDSRNGVRDVTPWMISQFPRFSKHIEEITHDGRFLRVWTEVFDTESGRLLSVSALGEPFASIAIIKPKMESSLQVETVGESSVSGSTIAKSESDEFSVIGSGESKEPSSVVPLQVTTPINDVLDDEVRASEGSALGNEPLEALNIPSNKSDVPLIPVVEQDVNRDANAFRKQQADQWTRRGEACKPRGLVRIALLQANFDLTYQHPFVETCPTHWPFCTEVNEGISLNLKNDADSKYGRLMRAVERHDTAHAWTKLEYLPSWSEHRRRSILKRVVDTCQSFGVDLLVLPEYSVRRETVEWLKTYIVNKGVSVLAGTYMNICDRSDDNHLSAPLTLLWPLPKSTSKVFLASLKKRKLGSDKDYDALQRGHVLEFSRNKKYRSIALDEFFRPSPLPLKPLFNPSELATELERVIGLEPSAEVVTHLLTKEKLPLKYLLELICSEAFLVSSPANYIQMGEDLKAMWRRFGRPAEIDEVYSDLKLLSEKLSITGNGAEARRSILAVPAATSRSADYWFAGQSGFLAAGTTTVFCNSIDGDKLVGGSCFIGQGSWKSEEATLGYLAKITPYHGWSKGVYYNNREDALSKKDQALVIADVDPHNMLEGKPRAQTMPAPLQLVAYLPLVESVDWARTQSNLLKALSISLSESAQASKEKGKNRPIEESDFWKIVGQSKDTLDEKNLEELWRKFPDSNPLLARAMAHRNNGDMQPNAPKGSMGLFAAPAFYDWIDVSLTLAEQQELPSIAVYPWKAPES